MHKLCKVSCRVGPVSSYYQNPLHSLMEGCQAVHCCPHFMHLIEMLRTGSSAQLLSHAQSSCNGIACYQGLQSKSLRLISCSMSAMLRVAAMEKPSCTHSFIACDELSHANLRTSALPTLLKPSVHGNTTRVRAQKHLTSLIKTLEGTLALWQYAGYNEIYLFPWITASEQLT